MIKALDMKWKNSSTVKDPFILQYTDNHVSNYFKEQQEILPDEYGEIFLTNKFGALVASTTRLSTFAHAHKYWWQGAYNNGLGSVFFDDRGYDDSVDGYVLGIVVPIRNAQGIAGILKCNVNIMGAIDKFISPLQNNVFGKFKLVRSGGLIVFEKDARPLSTKVSDAVLEKLKKHDNGSAIVTIAGEKWIVGFSEIKLTTTRPGYQFGGSAQSIDHKQGNTGESWYVLNFRDMKTLLLPTITSIKKMAVTIIFILFILAIIAFILGHRFFSPASLLIQRFGKVAKGDFKAKINLHKKDEFGILAQSFNDMTKKLEHTTTSITALENEILFRKKTETENKDLIQKLLLREKRLKKQENELQAYKNMVSFSNDIMFLIDTNYKYQIVNGKYATYRKQPVEYFIGIDISDKETRNHIGTERKDIDRCLQGEIFRVQKWIEYPEQGNRYMDISYSPYRDQETIKGVIVECRDITDIIQGREEREELRKQLFQSQKMESIGTLAGGIAHDFNNILSSVLGYSELALLDVEPGSTLEERLKTIYAGGIRARDLVKQILLFARQSDDKLRPVHVANLAREVFKLIRSSVPATIDIKLNSTTDSIIMGNPTRIHQVLMNLLTNASQAMEEDGGIMELTLCDVRIESDEAAPTMGMKPGDYIRITVSDTGQGMPPEIMSSIFEPYFTTKKGGSGTGLGLALTHGIVENHGGTIQVQSTPGQGTIFTLFLPIIEEQSTTESHQMASHPAPLKRSTERILVVDDEPSITGMIHDFLEKLGYTVTVKNSSLEALDLFTTNPQAFDLVISDMTMPDMTGDKLSIQLLEIRADIPIILCTGYSSKTLGRTASEIGVRALLDKPIVNASLAAIMRNILDKI
ncbi:ATP-binding protein [Desulforhopalus vacuolatus]|uniref:ATP-binding protein n=1 Tax=Desulforhopalus vacuolatus TaxID=40414 RepID=UPI00308456F6